MSSFYAENANTESGNQTLFDEAVFEWDEAVDEQRPFDNEARLTKYAPIRDRLPGQFELVSRFMRWLSDGALVAEHGLESNERDLRMQEDVRFLLDQGSQFPVLRDDCISLMLQSQFPGFNVPVPVPSWRKLSFSLALTSDWILVAHDKAIAYEVRAKLLASMGRNQDALEDITKACELDPDRKASLELAEKLRTELERDRTTTEQKTNN